MKTRPLEQNEYKNIIELFNEGFTTMPPATNFKPKPQIAIALSLQASLGLRIGDVLKLKVSNFKNGKLETKEKKTGKLQYREINREVFDFILNYAIENGLRPEDKLFNFDVRCVQVNLKAVVDKLGLENIGTHSFRKMFATTIYETNNHNLELVKELLNHTSIATTQRYIRVAQSEINRASSEVNFIY